MAEGRDQFGYKDPALDKQLDNDDDEQEVDTTHPFKPRETFAPYGPRDPYHEGEQTEMSSMRHEQSGLPDTSYTETSFGGEDIPLLEPDPERKFIIDRLKSQFSKFKESSFAIMKGTKGKTKGQIVAVGTGGGEYQIMRKDGTDFTKRFLERFKDKLGPRTTVVIEEDRDTIREMKQRLAEA